MANKTGFVTVFSQQAVIFNHPDDYNTKYTIRAYDFVQVPDWVLNSEMYALLKQKNRIRLVESKADIAEIEDANGKIDNATVLENLDKTDEVETTIDYTQMKSKELYEICVEKGIEVEAKQSKDYYIEKLNA